MHTHERDIVYTTRIVKYTEVGGLKPRGGIRTKRRYTLKLGGKSPPSLCIPPLSLYPFFLLWIHAYAPRLNIRTFRLHITQYLGVMRVSQFSAAVIILLLLLSIPHPCISKRRRWRNGEEEVVNGRLDEWYFASQFSAHAVFLPVQDLCSHRKTMLSNEGCSGGSVASVRHLASHLAYARARAG